MSMCTNPITLPTRKRYICSHLRDTLFDTFACGQCEECQTKNMHEWQLRNYYEMVDTIEKGGYIYYDTLTYREEDHPHVKDLFPDLPTDLNCYCFNRDHIRKFFVKLRRYLHHYGYKPEHNLNYFLTTEYGTTDGYTHRCHLHILFYVKFKINPYSFSKFVSKSWSYGHTDGYGWKPYTYIMDHNVIDNVNFRVTNYICKYILKKSSYQDVITKRVNYLVNCIPAGLSKSEYASMRSKINRELQQFHLQGHFLGVRLLREIELDKLFLSPYVPLPTKSKVMQIFIPLYYRRKLFTTTFVDDFGHRFYDTTPLGLNFNNEILRLNSRKINEQLIGLSAFADLPYFDTQDLTHYLLYYRGRYAHNGDYPNLSAKSRYYSSNLYHYYSNNDQDHFNRKPFISNRCYGSYPNYDSDFDRSTVVDARSYINNNVYFNPEYENILVQLNKHLPEIERLRKSTRKHREEVLDSII